MSITFKGFIELNVIKYLNADYNESADERCLTETWLFLLEGEFISWSVKRQATSAMSTCEAEYMTLSEAEKKAL